MAGKCKQVLPKMAKLTCRVNFVYLRMFLLELSSGTHGLFIHMLGRCCLSWIFGFNCDKALEVYELSVTLNFRSREL